MFYSKKISGLVGVSINLDEAVETPASPDDILTPNPKKPKIKTLRDMERLRSLRPRQSSSEDSSSNELSRAILASSIR